MQDNPPPLGPGTSDEVAGFLRIFVGSVPVLGSAFNELMTRVIPNVRQQRVEDYLRYLNAKLNDADLASLKERLLSEPGADLFEEGGIQSARALSEERRAQIAAAVAKGLTGEEADLLNAKRMLTILRELDDGQVILLTSKLMKHAGDSDFRKRHEAVLTPVLVTINSTSEDRDRATVYAISRQKLLSLGLLRQKFKKPAKGAAPEMDEKTGMIAAAGDDISPLGRLLLRTLDLAEPDDI